MSRITHAEVRMYKMGTGDCFAVKFFAGEEVIFKIMIDAGTWSGSGKVMEPFIKNLLDYLDNYADVLIVTHEHKDHVHAFAGCEELFVNGQFEVGEIWMAWTENDGTGKVKEWMDKYGQKKKALGLAAEKLREVMDTSEFKKQFSGNKDGDKAMGARGAFGRVLDGFADLHLSFDDEKKIYKGGLAGMEVVKKKIKKKETRYFKPGDIIQDLGNAEGIKIYVLGPPQLYDEIKKEAGGEGESFDHNRDLRATEAFGAAILNLEKNDLVESSLLPFDEHYMEDYISPGAVAPKETDLKAAKDMDTVRTNYNDKDWRKIDFDWLYSAGSFALRMNGLTNNLSLAIAIEIEDNGKVMLFPGDAEFGSWESWHRIPWNVSGMEPGEDKENEKQKNFTASLLKRTVFYKVAHHLSHNGTAQRLGLEMMSHKDLAAMATLDYSNISEGWMSTMPNRALIKELLMRTKGRLMIMNENNIFFDFDNKVPIKEKIEEARSVMTSREKKIFNDNFKQTEHYIQYKMKF